jgi:hypothetical protein
MLSALLIHGGQEPPRNHKTKFETARKAFPNAFAAESVQHAHGWTYAPGADWNSLEEYYKKWLASRYEEFDTDPGVASSRVREANAVVNSGIRFLAKAEKMEADALDEAASVRAFGYKFSETSNAVGDVHGIMTKRSGLAKNMAHGSVQSSLPRRTIVISILRLATG